MRLSTLGVASPLPILRANPKDVSYEPSSDKGSTSGGDPRVQLAWVLALAHLLEGHQNWTRPIRTRSLLGASQSGPSAVERRAWSYGVHEASFPLFYICKYRGDIGPFFFSVNPLFLIFFLFLLGGRMGRSARLGRFAKDPDGSYADD